MKVCSKCKTAKPIDCFQRDRTKPDGHCRWCRDCKNADNKNWIAKNRDRKAASRKAWDEANPERIASAGKLWRLANTQRVAASNKAWRQNNAARKAETNKAWQKANAARVAAKRAANHLRRMELDLNYRIGHRLRGRMHLAVKRGTKGGSAVRDLGCTIDELKTYLERKFEPGMSWDNWASDGWHIDHIKALSKFDLTDREQFLVAVHYTNLQPLWWRDNIVKGDD